MFSMVIGVSGAMTASAPGPISKAPRSVRTRFNPVLTRIRAERPLWTALNVARLN